MQAAVNVGSEALSEAQDEVVTSGLFAVEIFSDMGNLRGAVRRPVYPSGKAEGNIHISGRAQVMPTPERAISATQADTTDL